MADLYLDEQSAPANPAAGKGLIWVDTAGILMWKDDTGRAFGSSSNAAIANQAGFAADTYVDGSRILIPSCGLQPKTFFHWKLSASKTAAGVAAPAMSIRIGAAGAIADAARLVLNGPAQTAIADVGTLNVIATVRNIGAAAVIQGTAWWDHRGTVASSTGGTGFANDGSGHVEGTSAGFDSTVSSGQFIGLSVNGGAAAAWTVTQAIARAEW